MPDPGLDLAELIARLRRQHQVAPFEIRREHVRGKVTAEDGLPDLRDRQHLDHVVGNAEHAARDRLAGRCLVHVDDPAPRERVRAIEQPHLLEACAHVGARHEQQRRFGCGDEPAVRTPLNAPGLRASSAGFRSGCKERIERLRTHVRRERQRQDDPLARLEAKPLDEIAKRRVVWGRRRRLRQPHGRGRAGGERLHPYVDDAGEPRHFDRKGGGVARQAGVAIECYHSTCSGCSIHGSNTTPIPHGSRSRSTS